MIAEYDPSGTMQARYVHGPGIDQPLVRYDGAGTGNKQSLHADERGSIVALSYGAAYAPAINRYDEFGKPQGTNSGRFQYTGQMWLPEAGLYHYKARAYAPHLGRFLQTDPIGYWDSPNLYAYVLNDPVNLTDPLGLQRQCGTGENPRPCPPIIVTGTRPRPRSTGSLGAGGRGGGGPSEEGRSSPALCGESDGAALRRVGGWASNVGAAVRVGGAIVAVGAPPVGATIALFGTAVDLFGAGLTLGGYAVDRDWRGAAGFAGGAVTGRLTGRQFATLGKGALRNERTGRFQRNPFGGAHREAKRRTAEESASRLPETVHDAIRCSHR